MDSTSALPPIADLPVCWTPTDQCIMENLLLDQSDKEEHFDATKSDTQNSPRTVELDQSEDNPKPKCNVTLICSESRCVHDKAGHEEDDRRARHREVQRRFIQRKKAEVERTKVLAQMLERKYRYLEVSAEERRLKLENCALRERVSAVETSIPRIPNVDPVQLLMQNQLDLVKEFYEPISPQVLASIRYNAQREYELSRKNDAFKTSGASVLGWSDIRTIKESSIKFVLSKCFPNVQAQDLIDLTWDSLCAPATYGRFFSPTFPIKMQVMQVINCNAIVIHRVLFVPHNQTTSNSLEFMWRVRLGDEFIIMNSTLQHNAVQQCLGASYQWTQMTTSLGFSTLDKNCNRGCILRHGGWVRTSTININYWCMEMFFMALRFESAMIAPVFALPSTK